MPATYLLENRQNTCLACMLACEKCFHCCMLELPVDMNRRNCVNSARICIEVCNACARLCAAGSEFAKDMAALCASVCRKHAALSSKYSDDPECAAAAAACLACAEACDALQAVAVDIN